MCTELYIRFHALIRKELRVFSDELLVNNTIRMSADGLGITMDLPARGRGTGRLPPAQIFIEIWGTLTFSADIYRGNPRVGLSLVLVPSYRRTPRALTKHFKVAIY